MAVSLDDFTQRINALLLGLLGRARGAISEIGLEEGLTHQQAMLLMYLGERGAVTMGELSHYLGTTQGVVTRIVDRILEKGLVVRKRDVGDRRVVTVSLSRRGSRLAARMTAIQLAEIRRFCEMVDEDDRETFLCLLERLGDELEAGAHDRPGDTEKG